MPVFIEIPGIGNVEAKNAASEKTLKEILAVMKGVQSNTKKKGGGSDDEDDGNKSILLKMMGPVGDKLYKLSQTVGIVSGGFSELNKAISGTISDFANVGDSVERAAKVIPVLGSLLGTVASASVKVNDALLEASKSGAGFGGSINEFARSASEAGMTLEKFGSLIARNGEGLLGFGATTEEGAKRFSQVSKALRQTAGDLYALGYSTDDINQGLANYGDLMRKQGLQGTMTNQQLAAGARNYLKEIDALAKITGEDRAAKEAQMKALATDAQFQMAMAGKSAEARDSFMKLIGGFGPTLGNFVKDYVATGTLTTEANQKLAFALGSDTMKELDGLRRKINSNQALTAEEQDRLRSIIKKAATASAQQVGSTLAATREYDDTSKGIIEGMQIQEGAVKKTAEEQRKAALESSGFNKKMQEIQQRLAAFSNAFQVTLAKSGVLDVLIGAFTVMANLVNTFIVPAFNLLTGAVSMIGKFIGDYVYPAFLTLAAFVQVEVLPIFKFLGEQIKQLVTPALEYMGGIIKEYIIPAFTTVSDFISKNLTPIIGGLAASFVYFNGIAIVRNGLELAGNALMAVRNGLLALTNINLMTLAGTALAASIPFLKIAVPVLALIAAFKLLYDAGWSFGTAFEAIGDNLKRFFIMLQEGFLSVLDKITFGDANKAVKQKQAELATEKQILDEKEKLRDQQRETTAQERKAGKDQKERAEAAAKLDKKIIGGKEKYADTIEKSNKTIDMNSSTEALAKQFAEAEGSYLIPKDKKDAAAKADATKKEIENKAEEKTKAEEKAKEEIKKETESKPSAPTQETAESLLAQLNTNMARLVRIASEQKDIGERQLGVQKSLSGDLFAA